MGIQNNLVVQRGWAEKWKRSYAEQPGRASQRLNIVAAYAYGKKEIVAPFEFSGTMNTDLFTAWFAFQLLPELPRGSVVIMDNARFHFSEELTELAEAAEVVLLYLPAYSPDLNVIEKVWANLKREYRKCVKSFQEMKDAITHAFNSILF